MTLHKIWQGTGRFRRSPEQVIAGRGAARAGCAGGYPDRQRHRSPLPAARWDTRRQCHRSPQSEILVRVHLVPVLWLVLQFHVKPRHDCIMPFNPLFVIEDMMVFAIYQNHLHIFSQDFQGCIILEALTYRHIRISRSVQQQY